MQGGDFAAVAGEPIGEVLKESPLRSVVRLRPRGERGPCVLKIYHAHGIRERVRALWLRSRARVEERNLVIARARGLPCPAPLRSMVVRAISPRTGYLLLEDLGPGRSLADAVASGGGPEVSALLARAGALLARALAAGMAHRDLHLGNLFVGDDGALHLLDLHAVRWRHRPVPATGRWLRGLYLGLPWPEQAGLRRALFAPLGAPATPRDLGRWLTRHLRKRLARALRSSGSFVRRIAADGTSWLQRRHFPGDPDAWRAELAAGEAVKTGRRGQVVRTALGWGKLRDEAAAGRLWRAAEALALRGVPHPTALAWFAGPRDRWWVLSASRPGPSLDALASRPLAEQLRAAGDLGGSLGRLHATGWRCRDARGDNFVAADGRVAIVDLDGVQPLPWVGRGRAIAADIGRLLAWAQAQAPQELRARLSPLASRFLLHYLRERAALGYPAARARRLLRAASTRSHRWTRRHP